MTQKLADISALMQSQMRIKGRSLAVQYRRAGRLLPRAVRRDLRYLMETAALGDHPKLARMVDQRAVDRAYRNVTVYLNGLDPKAARMDRLLRLLASLALVFLAVFAVVLYALVERGLV